MHAALRSDRKKSQTWWLKSSLRPLSRPTGRHAFAAAALAVAIGMTVGMGIMVKSFEGTVQAWIGTSLHADLYIAPIGAVGAAQTSIRSQNGGCY